MAPQQPLYFIRHTAGLLDHYRSSGQRSPESRGCIAIHYEAKASANPADYQKASAKSTIDRLAVLGRDGGLVYATYGGQPEVGGTGHILGVVKPGTKITFNSMQGGKYILKEIQLHDIKAVRPGPSDHTSWPQGGTLVKWTCVEDRVRRLFKDGKLGIECLSDLNPDNQEILCSEWLRTHGRADIPRLSLLIAPPGKTMKGLDIVGISDGGRSIHAQVTHFSAKDNERKVREKIKLMNQVSQDDEAIKLFFCRHPGAFPKERHGCVLIDIDEVFSEFRMGGHAKWFADASNHLPRIVIPAGTPAGVHP